MSSYIQVDMFEVSLGAAILLQFRTGEGLVRVLADGGVTGHPIEHVHGKLTAAFRSFDADASRRIDLIIGTHYDADHLDGLVPIIEDETISIGEVWLPPVANDAQPHAAEDLPDDALLALQFAGEAGDEMLHAYLAHKAEICEALRSAELRAGSDDRRLALFQEERGLIAARDREPHEFGELFAAHFTEATKVAGVPASACHADEPAIEPSDLEPVLAAWPGWGESQVERLVARWEEHPERAAPEAASLAFIRRSEARSAINATALAAVVKVAKARKLRIRAATIEDGVPRRFIWDAHSQRFDPSANAPTPGPELILLGPSTGLVKKHWDRLPIGDYMGLVAFSRLPSRSITPSNQLSYVAKFSFAGQSVLITGDSGFVDFKVAPRARAYHPALLQTLAPLQVVQIAHHGGNNADFYNVLLASPYQQQTEPSWLLLSHAVDDAFRPSDLFSRFIEQLATPTRNLPLLFTCRPKEQRVRDVKSRIAPVAGGSSQDAADVRLCFSAGEWVLEQHRVAVP